MTADSRARFPDPRRAGDDGLLSVGGDLSVDTLLEAYRAGIFPWPQEGLPLLWFSPKERGVLDFDEVHWPRRFLRELRATEQLRSTGGRRPGGEGEAGFAITFDQAFGRVIAECAAMPRRHERGTWILPEMQQAYRRLHEAGYAHSVECWWGAELVGGLYGVYVDGVFSGESMFHKVSGASKRCLLALVERLRAAGLEWMDIQMVTPVLNAFGGKYIDREEYLERLERAHAKPWPKVFG